MEDTHPNDKQRPRALIVGAGIEGMGVALLLADAGHPVYLLDSAPWLGGSMHLLDRTFPSDSCGICLMAPTQPSYCPTLECGLHRNITALTHTEILSVSSQPERSGNPRWQVAARQKPRYIIDAKCTRCGLCLAVCPEAKPGLYEEHLAPVRAVYRPPSRAVPDAPVIDMAFCTRCGRCVEVCPYGAIDLDMAETTLAITVDAIALCPGYQPFDARLKGEYGYGYYDNVVSSLQFERMTSASGATGGRLARPSDGRPPQRIAFIHCVGSRDKTVSREYCASVCCMYTAKQAAAAKKIAPDAEIAVFHLDIRASGKGYEDYFVNAQRLPGVTYCRSMVSSLIELQQTKDLRLTWLGSDGRPTEGDFDLVVLAVGLAPAPGWQNLARSLGLPIDTYGFCLTNPTQTRDAAPDGVFVGGMFRRPMDIPEVVVDAAQVAGQASAFLTDLERARCTQDQHSEGDILSSEERAARDNGEQDKPTQSSSVGQSDGQSALDARPRVGVFIQVEGPASSDLDLEEVMAYAAGRPGVALARRVDRTVAALKDAVASAITEAGVNRLLIVGDHTLTHRSPLLSALQRLGLPPDAVDWVNLLDGCALVHQREPESRQVKAQQMLDMALARSREDRLIRWPPEKPTRGANPGVLVIGGGPSGMAAALALARQGRPVHLVERERELGGQLRGLRTLLSGEDPQAMLANWRDQVSASSHIRVYLEAEVRRIEGRAGQFVATLRHGKQSDDIASSGHIQVEHGAVIIASGAVPVVPSAYGYGQDGCIWTQRELEERLADDPALFAAVRRIAMIQCVESRDESRRCCSRVCCSQAIKNALAVKRQSPGVEVLVLYRDIRTSGLQELDYQAARQAGVVFLRYELPDKPVVHRTGSGLQIEVIEPMLKRKLVLAVDRVVLSVGIAANNTGLAQALGLPLDGDGFFQESHAKMRPLDFTRPGFYVCGLAQGPRDVYESIAQGEGAAMRAGIFLTQATDQPRETIVAVNDRLCCGCGLCVSECPYEARFIDVETGKARVIDGLCLGCGACAVVCRNQATQQHGYEKARVMATVEAALG